MLIQGTSCSISGELTVPSNKNVQCATGTTLLYTNTDNANPLFKVDNVQNVSISGCQMDTGAAFPYGWNAKIANSNYTSNNFFILIGNYTGQPSNVLVTGNRFLHVRAQAAVEAYANASSTQPSGISINFNDFVGCGLYGATFDNVKNSTISNNYALDCILGPELDGAGQSVPNVQENGNYVVRDANSTGWGYECQQNLSGQSGCEQYFSGMTCGTVQESVADYSGCTASGNTCSGGSGTTNYPTNIYIGTKTSANGGGSLSGNYTNNTLVNGCYYQQR